MATFFEGESHTFSEYLLVPGYSSAENVPANVSLRTPLVKFRRGEEPALSLNIPMVSAIMQSVSGVDMGVALAIEGGLAFIYGNQSPEAEAAMVKAVKDHKAGFVESDSTLTPDMTMEQVIELKERTGHSTMPVTDDGSSRGKLLGIVTSRDYRPTRDDHQTRVAEFMTPREKLIVGDKDITLKRANDVIWENKLNALPVVDDNDHLMGIVFRKDYDQHKSNPDELLDANKRYMVGAGINTRDYAERVPLLVDAGADVLCIDSSEGFSEWQKRTIEWIRANYGDSVKVGAGNVVDADGFRFLAACGADFVKVGIGGGSICITRETKGIGRGQASAVIDVCRAHEYFRRRASHISLLRRRHRLRLSTLTLALAMGSLHDARSLLRRFDESPTERCVDIWQPVHEGVLGRGSSARPQLAALRPRAAPQKLGFVEGVNSYVPYAGSCARACATRSIDQVHDVQLRRKDDQGCSRGAPDALVSSASIVEGGARRRRQGLPTQRHLPLAPAG